MRKIMLVALVAAACGGNTFTAGTSTPAEAGSPSTGAGDAGGSAPAGGSAGTLTGGGGNAGEGANGGVGGNAGLSGAGSSGSAGSSGGAGSAGNAGSAGAGAPSCPELFSRAKAQLDAASVCDDSAKVQQCTGTVTTTCGCKVPIEKNDSLEAKAYLSTLAQINQKNCHENCPLIACAPVANPQCNVPNGSNNNAGICANGVP